MIQEMRNASDGKHFSELFMSGKETAYRYAIEWRKMQGKSKIIIGQKNFKFTGKPTAHVQFIVPEKIAR
jgi:hypothetical protein